MSEWKTYKLGDLVTFQRGHDLTRNQMQDGPYQVAGSNGVIGFHNEYTTKAPSITIGRSGNIGNAYYFNTDFWAHNTTLYIKEFKNCDPKFIYYLLQTMNFGGHNSGSAVPSLNRNYIHLIEVKAPDLPTQRQIAQILSSLDNKIELNLQMNQTLEAMAQAIFKEWFVNFNFPGFDGELVDGLPKGWKVGKLGELCSNIRVSYNPVRDEIDSRYIGLEHIPRKSIMLSEWGHSNDINSQKSQFQKEDILFGKLRPYFHKVVIAPFNGICSTDILVIRSIIPKFQLYTYFHLFSDECISYSNSHSDGTQMPRVNWNSLSKFQIPIPLDEILIQFQEIIQPFFEKVYSSIFENESLTQTRDTLLPKLMSGKIRLN